MSDTTQSSSSIDVGTYTSVSCLNNLLSADNIINQWKNDRNKHRQLIDNIDTFNWTNILPVDNECMYKLNTGRRPFSQRMICAGCSILSQLNSPGNLRSNTIFDIRSGKHTGMKLFIREIPTKLHAFRKSDSSPKDIANSIIRRVEYFQGCEPSFLHHVKNTDFWISGGGLENYITISWLLEDILSKEGFLGVPILQWAYQCGNNTYIVEEYPNYGIGSIKDIAADIKFLDRPRSPKAGTNDFLFISRDTVKGILAQVFSMNHHLMKYGFIHGDIAMSTFGFSSDYVNFKYDGTSIKSMICVHLIPSQYSSISIPTKNIRIFNHDSIYQNTFDLSKFPTVLSPFLGNKSYPGTCRLDSEKSGSESKGIPCLSQLLNNKVVGYTIGNRLSDFISYQRNLGIPLFHSSFNTYAMFTALMTNYIFAHTLLNDAVLLPLWTSLWKLEQYPTVMKKLKTLQCREYMVSSTEIAEFLSNFTLRCDATDEVWAQMKKILS